MTQLIIIRTEDQRRFRCRPENIEQGWASNYTVWGKKWDYRKQRWSVEDDLYYVSDYEVEH